MFDLFNILLASTIVLVVGFIVFSIRKTMKKIDMAGLTEFEAKTLAAQIRQREVTCPRCGQQSSALIETESEYRCDTCNDVFKGPKHISET